MVNYKRANSVSLVQQQLCLQKLYPNLIENIGITHSELRCVLRLQPTPESIQYKVKMNYKLKGWPKARLIEPKEIAKVDGKKPHHLYDRDNDGKERLCVFNPQMHEWSDNMFIADTFVPWIITWLSAYEIWQITGTWVYPEAKRNSPILEKKKS